MGGWFAVPVVALIFLWLGLRMLRGYRSRTLRRIARSGRAYLSRFPTTKTWDIAISFSGRDGRLVAPILDLLHVAGLKVFDYQDEDVAMTTLGRPLDSILNDIYGVEADVTVAFLSPHYFHGTVTQEELQTALERDPENVERRLIPVLLRSCNLSPEVQKIIHLDARKSRPETVAQKILEVLHHRAATTIASRPLETEDTAVSDESPGRSGS